MMTRPDILIVGGGLTGTLLALALKTSRYSVLLCDEGPAHQKMNPSFDARSIALNQASQNILYHLGLWNDLKPYVTPIQHIHVSSQGQFGCAALKANPERPLGVVVEMHRLHEILNKVLPELQVRPHLRLTGFDVQTRGVQFTTVDGSTADITFHPQLLVAADGTDSTLRRLSQQPVQRKAYLQHALVANIGLKHPHHGKAFEHFTSEGPLALLPLEDNRMSLVWCCTPLEAKRLDELPEPEFLKALQIAFGYRLGRFSEAGRRQIFPLTQQVMPHPIAEHLVFIGNAAQTLHPIAGQGLNLGLRDLNTLAACILEQGLDQNMLKTYESKREPDRRGVIQATDGLLQLFQNKRLSWLRQLALFTFDQSSLLQSMLIRYAGGIR